MVVNIPLTMFWFGMCLLVVSAISVFDSKGKIAQAISGIIHVILLKHYNTFQVRFCPRDDLLLLM